MAAVNDFKVKNGLQIGGNVELLSGVLDTSGVSTFTNLLNTPTTITAFAAATTLTIAAPVTTLTIAGSSTVTSTFNIGSGVTATGNTKTLNLGTGGAAGSTTNINLGSPNGGTTTVNSATLSIGSAATINLSTATATATTIGLFTGLSNVSAKVINIGTSGSGGAVTVNLPAVSTVGNVVIGGNLTVSGTTTTVNSTIVSVQDINIELGSVTTPTDVTALNGGITLRGSTNKTINWTNTNWTSSEHWDLATGKSYKINNVVVLSATALGSSVISSSLTSVGTIGTGVWNGSLIGATYGGTGVNNGSNTITLGGSLTTSGAFATTLTVTGITNVTLPTSGTLVNTAVTTLSSLASVGTITTGTWSGSFGAVSGANLLSLTAGNLSGTIPSAVLGNSAHFIGTTSVALNRASANLALSGISAIGLPGATSGTVTIQAAAVAGVNTITFPASTGTVVTTGDTGSVTNTMLAGSIATSKITGLATSATTDTTNASNISSGILADARISGTLTGKTYNGLSLAAAGTGFTIAGGTTSKTLSINNSLAFSGTDGTTTTMPATSGTVALNNQTFFIGTTSVAINRASASLSLTGVNIDGNAGTVTNGVYTTTISTLAPSLTGTGASGTWGISVTGNAATASSVAWASIPDHPTDNTYFTNGAGYVTSAGTVAACSGNAATASAAQTSSTLSKQTCKAWVKWHSAYGVPTIDASYNVSSLTDNGVGDTTVNFTSMADANYAFVGTCGNNTSVANVYTLQQGPPAPTAAAFRFYTMQVNIGLIDLSQVSLTFIGN